MKSSMCIFLLASNRTYRLSKKKFDRMELETFEVGLAKDDAFRYLLKWNFTRTLTIKALSCVRESALITRKPASKCKCASCECSKQMDGLLDLVVQAPLIVCSLVLFGARKSNAFTISKSE